jgi:iron complex transport system substrate-binding protein
MKKRLTALVLSLIMILALAACTPKPAEPAGPADTNPPADNTPEEITLTDMIGREITVTPGSYKRVVCIGAGALRMYSYIGDVQLLAGVEDIDNLSLSDRPKMFDKVARPYLLAFSGTFEKLPSCGVGGPNAQAAEAEKILSCDPDIVISEYEDVDKENALQEQLGVPVVTLRTGPAGVFAQEFRESILLLGTVFDRYDRANDLVAYVQNETLAIESRTKDIPDAEKPSVYICGLGNWGTTDHLMTAQGYKPFEIANIKNAVTDLEKGGIQKIEAEKFVAVGKDADIMFIDAAAVKNIKPLFKEDKTLLDPVKAWKEGNVYLEMAYNAYYTNYEIALANTWYYAKCVYPDRFADVDMGAKLNEITKAFLGQNLADAVFATEQSFGGYQKIDTSSFFN